MVAMPALDIGNPISALYLEKAYRAHVINIIYTFAII
jgi:hypothetical protein